jgi:hypothetical protein
MHFSLHRQQYQSSQLSIHRSVRFVVLHLAHLGRSSGAGFLTVSKMPSTRTQMKMTMTIPVITPLLSRTFT